MNEPKRFPEDKDERPASFPAPQPEPAQPPDRDPMTFFERSQGPEPRPTEPETPEEARRRDAREKVNFLANAADRLKERKVSEPALGNALEAIERRYRQWREEHTALIASLPDPDMRYSDRETAIRLGDMATALHRDVDRIVSEGSEHRRPSAQALDRELRAIEQREQRNMERGDSGKDIDL